MKRLIKKSDRLAVQAYEFESLIKKGFAQETYKGLNIFSKAEEYNGRQTYLLKVFINTAAKPADYRRYGTLERLNEVIAGYKASYDRREAYKAEQKEKGGYRSSAAMAAAAIREKLKSQFPGIKFSVTSENFAGGNAVRVDWSDGPTEDEVQTITGKHQYGKFNGMEDMYEYSNVDENTPQAKYVTERRQMSPETRAALEAAALEIWPGEEYERERSRKIYELYQKSSLPVGATVTGIERGEESNRWTERIVYTAPEAQTKSGKGPDYEPLEVKAGEVNIVDYSEKAFAVIGDTKSIKDKLKELGGKFNGRLSCGPGWIFSKKRLEAVTKALSGPTVTGDTESAKNPELMAEVKETLQWMAETDQKQSGQVSEGTKAAINTQGFSLQESSVKQYESLKDIEEAANSGQVISLYNLHELVNK